jgi:tetratricopeptide (TPR) repeat protein
VQEFFAAMNRTVARAKQLLSAGAEAARTAYNAAANTAKATYQGGRDFVNWVSSWSSGWAGSYSRPMSFVDQVGALLAAGDLAGAGKLVDAASGVDRELGRAQLALARQDVKGAAECAKQAVAQGGGATAHHLLAAAKLFGGDPQGAVDEARRAVGLDGSAASRSKLGGILHAAGRAEDALAVLKQVVVEAPDDADAHTNLANAAVRMNDYGQAIQSYARAFECRPGDQKPIQQLVAMFIDLGKWMGAMAALELQGCCVVEGVVSPGLIDQLRPAM